MSNVDTKLTHITPAGGNVFADMGFGPEEAAKLKIKSQLLMRVSASDG